MMLERRESALGVEQRPSKRSPRAHSALHVDPRQRPVGSRSSTSAVIDSSSLRPRCSSSSAFQAAKYESRMSVTVLGHLLPMQRNNRDWAGCVVHDLVADRPQKKPLRGATSPGPDDQQFGPDGLLDEHRCRPTFYRESLYSDTLVRNPLQGCV